MKIYKSRYSILFAFVLFFIGASFLIRTVLFALSFTRADITLVSLLKIYGLGLLFDITVAGFVVAAYSLYLLLLPQKWNHSLFNRIVTYTLFFIVLLLITFSFFAEITFWQEFESRFNFIAVDYLVYTYEVINNINESYPLPILISGMLAFCLLLTWFFYKRRVFANSFSSVTPFTKRLLYTGSILFITFIAGYFMNNSLAEKSDNRYQNELSKAGIFSFFAAFKNNELSYDHFYKLIDNKQAFKLLRTDLMQPGTEFKNPGETIERFIKDSGQALRPNVIMVTIESFSAEFMGAFGNTQKLTPVLDSLAAAGILFTNMYATGTRTVRGMEALSLAVPPTPGSSIVRRPNNDNLTTVGNIFKEAGYARSFLYGGDGYFDNMNQYFGNNGYNVVDRGRNILVKDRFNASRTIIPDSLVNFENAWGICDEDLYDAVIRNADSLHKTNKLFYDFVMTTSNHRPFTFPAGKINFASGSGRDGAIRYTDYAIGAFLQKAKTKAWFNNTVFIFVADHCASSAGKNEIDISKYHIPCIVYYPAENKPLQINELCSQIDLYPTLFKRLHWSYTSNGYGKDVLAAGYSPRVMLGTYQKLAYIKRDSLVILSPQQKVETYLYNFKTNSQVAANFSNTVINEAIANYQTAYYLFKNNGLKQPVENAKKSNDKRLRQ